jgi:apolipoprotein N-acyltransferase
MSFLQNRWLSRGLPLLSGATLVFAFPNWNQEWAVWLGLLPLLVLIWGPATIRRPFWPGYFAGLAFFIPNLAWVRHSSRVMAGAVDHSWIGLGPELMGFGALIGLSAYCAVYFGLWTWFAHRCARPDLRKLTQGTWQVSTWESLRCSLLAAAAWVACEWLRSTTVFTGFGWNGLGVGLHRNLRPHPGGGSRGRHGPVLPSCVRGLHGLEHPHAPHLRYRGEGTCKTRLDFTVALMVMLVTAGYGMLMRITEKPWGSVTVRTVLVQPYVAQVGCLDGPAGGAGLSSGSTNSPACMLCPGWQVLHRSRHLAGERPAGEPPRQGLSSWKAGTNRYFDDLLHSATSACSPARRSTTPPKTIRRPCLRRAVPRQLRPTGRSITRFISSPSANTSRCGDIPPFSFLRGVLPGDFVPGDSTEPLQLEKPEVQLIPLICFEDTVGRVARRFVREAPQMIVNLSNDGWFLQSVEMEVQLINALFRAIELRRPMVRATNTGVTCFIDTLGRITHRSPIQKRAAPSSKAASPAKSASPAKVK